MTEHLPLPDGSLTASELALVLAELDASLRDGEVADTALLDGRDDLLLFVATADGRRTLQLAPGGRRARVCTTTRRFPARALATGPRPDRVAELLRGARIVGFEQPPGERRFTIHLRHEGRELALECELFGARGLWVIRETDRRILALSRLPNVAGRSLRPGDRYDPPAARTATDAVPATRFEPPADAAVDRAFTALDLAEEADAERLETERALTRELARRKHRLQGLERQRLAMDDAADERLMADMLMAYGPSLPPGAAELRAPHPTHDGAEVVVPRDTTVPPHVQAQALYKRARKHEDGRAEAERQLAAARTALADLEALRPADDTTDPDAWREVRRGLERLGVLQPARPPKPDAAHQRVQKLTHGENLRRFESVEGMLILVGRDNAQNDRLATRIARGNDLWLHVGRGYAGSHVVVRVPKGKTASLETLLDAATLAIHFSKVRGAELEEVIYTQAKNVRKAKGMPSGRVLATRTRSLRVRLEPDRLTRLLSTADPSPPPAAGRPSR